MAFVYDHTAAVTEEAMYNEHNYEFTSMMFTLADLQRRRNNSKGLGTGHPSVYTVILLTTDVVIVIK
jgi:hypothetical protein